MKSCGTAVTGSTKRITVMRIGDVEVDDRDTGFQHAAA